MLAYLEKDGELEARLADDVETERPHAAGDAHAASEMQESLDELTP